MRPILLGIAAIAIGGAAAPTARLAPGLWRVDTVPVGATLDGRPLGDLPYTANGPQSVCMSPAEAVDPARWFTRDSGTGCAVSRGAIVNGRVDIRGNCPGQAAGDAPGTVQLTGTWTPDRYDLRFATTTVGENGKMGFTGTIAGRRVGACPAAK
ncbi:DUF3617 domain-containing protein [uncultured Sphingomonas sp.]|uniref:DUF3617 domain-containing protein n=1 Tax=uncultured Sphingomonas sp. TaxID=158754 RepID=UPI0035CC44F6